MHRNSFFNGIEHSLIIAILSQLGDLTSEAGTGVSFIEVGANDGVNSNYLYSFIKDRNWSGLSIEPVPQVFEKLSRNYSNFSYVTCLNLAIAEQDGSLPFFAVQDRDSVWYPMLSSFDKDVILRQKHMIPDVENHITEIQVTAKTLKSICREHSINRLDVLVVDAEGYDDIIIRTMDLIDTGPSFIIFEHKHLSIDRLYALDTYLRGFGYERLVLWADTCYIRGQIAMDKCVMHIRDSLPVLFPHFEPEYGNGNWQFADV